MSEMRAAYCTALKHIYVERLADASCCQGRRRGSGSCVVSTLCTVVSKSQPRKKKWSQYIVRCTQLCQRKEVCEKVAAGFSAVCTTFVPEIVEVFC